MGFSSGIKRASPGVLNSWLLFITLFVMVAIFIFYTFFYVKNNEEEQIAKRFRVLAQIGENVVDRKNGFVRIVRYVRKSVNEEIAAKQKEVSDEFKLELTKRKLREQNRLLRLAAENSIEKRRYIEISDIKNDDGSVGKKRNVIYIKAGDFFQLLERPDVFDEFVAFRQDQPGKHDTVLYHTFPGDVCGGDLGKLEDAKKIIESGSLKDIELLNRKYKLWLQPVRFGRVETWYVGGLVERDKFVKETRELRHEHLILFLMLFLIFILGIPLLKLRLMSTFEQLNTKDVVLTALSVILGLILVVLLLLFVFHLNMERSDVKDNLKGLSTEIKESFIKELNKGYLQLAEYEEFLNKLDLRYKGNISNILSLSFPGRDIFGLLKVRLLPTEYPLFKNVFWMNEYGWQIFQLSTRRSPGGLVRLAHRRYFQEAGNWRLPGNTGSRFMLESITSVTSGEKLGAISIPSALQLKDENEEPVKGEVAALTSQMTSVIDTVMPVGYGFCIIDKGGEAWFHSDTERNLQENFLDETENSRKLLSAIRGEQAGFVPLNYQSRRHLCYITPLPNMPLFLITFRDMRFTASIHTYTIIYAVFFILVLLLFNGLLVFFAAGMNYRKPKLKRMYAPFNWLRPLEENKSDYEHLTVCAVFAITLLVLFKIFTDPSRTLFLCMSAALVFGVYTYCIISGCKEKNFRLSGWNLTVAAWVCILIVDMADYLAAPKGDIILPIFQFGLLVGFGLLKIWRVIIKVPFERAYGLFLAFWLALICVVPLMMFYVDGANQEKRVALKHFQLELARSKEARDYRIDEFYREKMGKVNQHSHHINFIRDTRRTRQEEGMYVSMIGGTRLEYNKKDFSSTKPMADVKFNRILHYVKPIFDPISVDKKSLVYPAAANDRFEWRQDDKRLHFSYLKEESLSDGANDRTIYISSDIGHLKSIPLFVFLLFVLGLTLVIGCSLLHFATRRIFGLKLLENGEPSAFTDRIREQVNAGSSLIIYCLTREDREYYYRSLKDRAGSKVKFRLLGINFSDQTFDELVKEKSREVVVVTDFSPADDERALLKQVKQMGRLLKESHIQVVLLAVCTSLEEKIELYEERLAKAEKKKDKTASELKLEAEEKEIVSLLNKAKDGLLPLYAPLKKAGEEQFAEVKKIEDEDMRALILKEFKPAEYFKDIEADVCKFYHSLPEKQGSKVEEKIVIKIQKLAQQYYQRLLECCSKKEKFILYDIAQDMLVNANNEEVIKVLRKRGLLVYDNTFKLMNESFRNYIVSTVDSEEARHFMHKSSLRSKWKNYKAPFSLIVLGLLVFLAFQENLLNHIDALITSVIGVAAILTRFSGVLSGLFIGRRRK